jgi:hypothetical protein
MGSMVTGALSQAARILLWDYERGSRVYDVLCLVLFLILAFFPTAWWNDPMVNWR